MSPGAAIGIAGVELRATASGALWWPDAATLVAADLHLEKGSSFARRGRLLPPYDSRATLSLLAVAVEALQPRRVVLLGDSFHDDGGFGRLAADDVAALCTLARGREWLWVAGNHDPLPPAGLPGEVAGEVALAPLVFRHEAAAGADPIAGEISGHLHPKASIVVAGRRLRGRCFVGDDRRLILPAFGAYAGGLDVADPAIASLLAPAFTVHLLGRRRVHSFPVRPPSRTAQRCGGSIG